MGGGRVLLEGLGLPEGPRWRDGWLYLADVWAGDILRVNLDGTHETLAGFAGRPNGLGFLPDGRLIAVSMQDRNLFRLQGDQLALAADLSAFAGDLANDMVIDAHGHAYVGSHLAAPGDTPLDRLANGRAANLILVDFSRDPANPTVQVAAQNLQVPNGMAVTPDGATLIVAETAGRRLTAFTIGKDGALSRRRLWAELDIAPDGIALDAEGCVWAATPYPQSQVVRVAEGGKVLERLPIDGAAYACAIGDGKLFTLEASFPANPDDRHGRVRVWDF